MRSLRLARIMAEAEGLRLRRLIRRTLRQAIYGVIALVFVLGALAWLHVTGYLALRENLKAVYAALIVVGVDVVIAGIFGLMASSSSPDRVEREALQLRNTARNQLAITTASASVLAPAARMLGFRHLSGLLLGALAGRYMGRG
jgi:hypothetical protein